MPMRTRLPLMLALLAMACGQWAPWEDQPVMSPVRTMGWQALAKERPIVIDAPLRQPLPGAVDLRKQMSPVADQGPFQACPAFAIAKGLQEYLLKQQGHPQSLSARFAWYAMRAYWDRQEPQEPSAVLQNTGVPVNLAMEAFQRQGTVTEQEFPYPSPAQLGAIQALPVARYQEALLGWAAERPTAEQFERARQFRLTQPVVQIDSLSEIRQALSRKRPVVLGFFVYESFFQAQTVKSGVIPLPNPRREANVGSHIMLAVGYDDAKRQLIVRNSYGPDWGDGGYGYVPYGYFQVKFEDGYPAVRGGYTIQADR